MRSLPIRAMLPAASRNSSRKDSSRAWSRKILEYVEQGLADALEPSAAASAKRGRMVAGSLDPYWFPRVKVVCLAAFDHLRRP